jgi:ankyrin repeat protein
LVEELGANVNQAHAETGATPLWVATLQEHLDVMRCLKELGADVNHADTNGFSPLWLAASQGMLDAVRCLKEELGADINQASRAGVTPLMAAAHNKYADVVIYLVKMGATQPVVEARAAKAAIKATAADLYN